MIGESTDNRRFSSCLFITGATASGKTSLGVEVARALDADVVSMDSMAIYRGLDVGTAKPTLEERAGVVHHMLDVVDPSEEYSAIDYLRDAGAVVDSLASRGRRAIFVGGTPLYLKTILFGVFDAPGADREYRNELAALEEREGRGYLWRELERVDPETAKRLHPNDAKRIIRALEVYKLTGEPISAHQRQFAATPQVDPRRVFILTRDRAALYERIDRRVDVMMRDGFLEETRRLLASPGGLGATASQAVGYRELASVLSGELTESEAVELIKRYTRNFAKRQETWFRSLEKIGARRVFCDDRSTEETRDELLAIVEAESL